MPKGVTKDTNIGIESKSNYRSMHNLDTFRDSYRIKAFVEKEGSVLKREEIIFLDINDHFMEQNRFFLLSRCVILEFQPRWVNRPNYLSYDQYGTQSFSYLLLVLNNCISALDFNFDYVKVPTIAAIKELVISNQRHYPNRDQIKDVQFL